MRRRNQLGNYCRDPCLTMHQPWASLLVYGIKRIEGRSWPAPIRGRLWIHAASKVPDVSTIKAMEDFYREIYALDGVTDLKFPAHYPVSKLIGCVEVVGCLRGEELACWKAVPEGVRLEALTDFCWLSEQPQKLSEPLKMRGDQGVYNLERKIAEAAVRGLLPVQNPHILKFPVPNPADYYSLRPGSVPLDQLDKKVLESEKPARLISAIEGARAAATQYSKKINKPVKHTLQDNDTTKKDLTHKLRGITLEEVSRRTGVGNEKPPSLTADADGARASATQFLKKDDNPLNDSPPNNVIDDISENMLKGSSVGKHRGNTGLDAESNGKIEGKRELIYLKKEKQLGSNSLRSSLDQQSTGSSLIFSSALRGIRRPL